jgi:hypothetical protein
MLLNLRRGEETNHAQILGARIPQVVPGADREYDDIAGSRRLGAFVEQKLPAEEMLCDRCFELAVQLGVATSSQASPDADDQPIE